MIRGEMRVFVARVAANQLPEIDVKRLIRRRTPRLFFLHSTFLHHRRQRRCDLGPNRYRAHL